jgi:pyruvate dehydrogenase E2 component (dihydrolipoamide acetyltransferase)
VAGGAAQKSGSAAPVAASAPPKPTDGKADGQTPPAVAAETPDSPVLAASMALLRPPSANARPHRRPQEQAPPAPPAPAAAKTAPSPLDAGPPYRIERASSLREAVARNMIASAATPTFRVAARLPIEPLAAAAKVRQQSLTLLLARACARTIAAHPLFNAAYTPEGLARRERIDVGIAVDSGDGLITPVLRDAAGRSLAALAQDWSALREKVKSRRLVPADYTGATFYLSDLGVFSVVEEFDSLIPSGASAILSVAASRPQGASCTLACDHRVVFGADAARFLETLRQQLSDPGTLLT